MFADRYPDEVVGMVLADASHPDQWANIPGFSQRPHGGCGQSGNRPARPCGLLRILRAERWFIAGYRPREFAEMRAYLARPQGWSAGAGGSSPGLSTHGSR